MFENRILIKTARLIQRTALFADIRPSRQKSAHNLLVAIHNATVYIRVFDALRSPFSQTQG